VSRSEIVACRLVMLTKQQTGTAVRSWPVSTKARNVSRGEIVACRLVMLTKQQTGTAVRS
jgi:hypothetical protein